MHNHDRRQLPCPAGCVPCCSSPHGANGALGAAVLLYLLSCNAIRSRLVKKASGCSTWISPARPAGMFSLGVRESLEKGICSPPSLKEALAPVGIAHEPFATCGLIRPSFLPGRM